MRRFPFLLISLLVAGPIHARQTDGNASVSERRVSYTMDVTLDPESRTVSGMERLTWRNPDSVPVRELQFHLYLNAFKNERSTFMKESGGAHRGNVASDDDPWGGVAVRRMSIAADDDDLNRPLPPGTDTDLTDRIRFIQPDDGNPEDETVIAVSLPFAVEPGESITLDIEFESRLPEIIARTGWKIADSGRPFFMVAQWFPKIGVYEIPGQRFVPSDAGRGEWNTHQFHANSEFYADFGTYDVTMTVPADYEVGATGAIQEDRSEGDFRVVRYTADDVHDFAWTASPDFLVSTDRWEHVELRLLLQPAHAGQEERHFDAAKIALDRFTEWMGEYPYTTLTLVDGIGGANGMEYPTLITCGTAYMLPKWLRALELVTIHEFGHQYFYGILASNEFEEAWLDEGMNSYLETRIMDDVWEYGSAIDFVGLQVSDTGAQRVAYTKNNPSRGALFTNSWEYAFGDYAKASYSKPATVMHTLERHLGWDTMRMFLRTYYDRWKFRHPTTYDLQNVAEDVAGRDLDWFFDQFVYGEATFDYEIASLSVNRVTANEAAEDSTSQAEPGYRSRVRVHRSGTGIFPQELLATFADGATELREWDGQAEWMDFTFDHPSRLAEAYIDPENKILLDTNRLNNRRVYVTEADNTLARKAQLRFTSVIQQVLLLFSGIL